MNTINPMSHPPAAGGPSRAAPAVGRSPDPPRETVAAAAPAAPAAPEQSREPAPARESLGRTVAQLNAIIQDLRRELHFSVDELSGHTIIKVIDVQTQEVIRQIPPEEAIALAQAIAEHGLTSGFRA